MLRWVIVLLLVANAGFYAWSNGHLTSLGFAPDEQREPERLQTQIRPEAMRLLNPPEPMAPAPAAPTPEVPSSEGPSEPAAAPTTTTTAEAVLPPTACWLARGFTKEEADALEKSLLDLALPKGSWRLEEVSSGGRWVVYMGRYTGDLLGKKKEELRELKVAFRTLNDPPLGPGLALGTYSSEAAAQQGLKDVARKGVNSARVAEERGQVLSHTLRLAEVTEQERAAVEGLGPSLLGDKTFQACN